MTVLVAIRKPNKNVLSLDLKVPIELAAFSWSGKEFQLSGPAIANERSPNVVLVLGMISQGTQFIAALERVLYVVGRQAVLRLVR